MENILDLQFLKRAELQKLAKEYGIKANMRNTKLIEALEVRLADGASNPEKHPDIKSPNVLKPLCPVNSPLSASDGSIDGLVTLDSVQPLWQDLSDSEWLSEDSFKSKSPKRNSLKTRENPQEMNDSKENISARRSSRTKATPSPNADKSVILQGKEKLLPNEKRISNNDSFKSKSTKKSSKSLASKKKVEADIKKCTSTRRSSRTKAISTPNADASAVTLRSKGNARSSDVKGKTFSVPKNRTRARITAQEKTPLTNPRKRRQSTENSKAKRKKQSGDDWKKGMREDVVSEIERKTGHASELRSFLPSRKIPVFSATGVTVGKGMTTPSDQKFAKMHEKTFGKMESIDDYQKRKEQRIEKLFGSSKKREKLDRLSKPKTPRIVKPVTRPKPSFMSPKSLIPPPSRKSSIKRTTFKPTITSTSKINTNFTTKASKLVTPKKVAVSFAKSPARKQKSPRTPSVAKRTSTAPRKSLTPFRPSNTLNTPQSAKKNTFNLGESLKKPLTWVPHKGPLKKIEDQGDKPTFKDRIKNFKNPKISTRDDRRKNMKKARSTAKTDVMMKRRGIK